MNWAIHPNYPDYEVSECGRVRRLVDSMRSPKAGDEVIGRVLKSGYRQFNLKNADGERSFIRANRLVLEAFKGRAPSNKHHAAHNDGNRLNNHLSNLRWATPKENNADKIVHGRRLVGETANGARFTDEQVMQMRALFTGKRGDIWRIGRKFGITNFSTIQRIIRGHTYGHLPLPGYSALERR